MQPLEVTMSAKVSFSVNRTAWSLLKMLHIFNYRTLQILSSRPRLSEGRVMRDENCYRVMDTEWHRITCFNGLGKTVAEHCEKGMQVLVHGRIRYDPSGSTAWGTTATAARSSPKRSTCLEPPEVGREREPRARLSRRRDPVLGAGSPPRARRGNPPGSGCS